MFLFSEARFILLLVSFLIFASGARASEERKQDNDPLVWRGQLIFYLAGYNDRPSSTSGDEPLGESGLDEADLELTMGGQFTKYVRSFARAAVAKTRYVPRTSLSAAEKDLFARSVFKISDIDERILGLDLYEERKIFSLRFVLNPGVTTNLAAILNTELQDSQELQEDLAALSTDISEFTTKYRELLRALQKNLSYNAYSDEFIGELLALREQALLFQAKIANEKIGLSKAQTLDLPSVKIQFERATILPPSGNEYMAFMAA